tara:strand:- start:4305 stop:4520 length:216 start_codon:yes stop_codon:yes gene_type:complete
MAIPSRRELKVLQGLVEFVREKTNYRDSDYDAITDKSYHRDFIEELRESLIFNNYLNEDDDLLRIISYLQE